MTHDEFVRGYRGGSVTVSIDRKAAGRFMAARMMLPWFLLPLFGLAVALALTGRLWWALGVFAAGIGLKALIAATSAGYVLQRSLADPAFFAAVRHAGVLDAAPR